MTAVPRAPQRRVSPAGGQQIVVAAEFGDAPVPGYRDAVGVVGGVEAVGDGDDGATAEHGSERSFGATRGDGVQGGGRLAPLPALAAPIGPRDRSSL